MVVYQRVVCHRAHLFSAGMCSVIMVVKLTNQMQFEKYRMEILIVNDRRSREKFFYNCQ